MFGYAYCIICQQYVNTVRGKFYTICLFEHVAGLCAAKPFAFCAFAAFRCASARLFGGFLRHFNGKSKDLGRVLPDQWTERHFHFVVMFSNL